MHTLHVVREELALRELLREVPAGTAAENVGGSTALWRVVRSCGRWCCSRRSSMFCARWRTFCVSRFSATQTDHDGASFDPIVAGCFRMCRNGSPSRAGIRARWNSGFRPATADVELPDEPTDRGATGFRRSRAHSHALLRCIRACRAPSSKGLPRRS